jgi:glycosyltransferase involved in cell wall biosynthesis
MNARPLKVWLPAVRAGSGADIFVLRLAAALRHAGHEPLLQWFDHRYELMPWRLRRMPAPAGTDVIHTGSWQGFAFQRVGLPLVVTEHQYIAHPSFTPHRRRLQALYHRTFIGPCARRSYRQADALVAVSEHTAAAMRADLQRPVEVIHNWVDCDHFTPSAAPEVAHARPFRLLFVGNPSRWKGADILPSLAEQLGGDFEIQCLGGLRKDFDASHLPDNMMLLPRTEPEHMPELYRAADAVLVPTRYEAFGYVAVEAMACGVPVLGFASTGTAEVALHGETALLAPVDDVAQLAVYARQLAADHSLRNRLAHAGRQRALDYFDEPKAIASYIEIYRRAMAQYDSAQ